MVGFILIVLVIILGVFEAIIDALRDPSWIENLVKTILVLPLLLFVLLIAFGVIEIAVIMSLLGRIFG